MNPITASNVSYVHVNAGMNIRSRSPAYKKILKEIEKSTPAIGGIACLSSPKEKDVMI